MHQTNGIKCKGYTNIYFYSKSYFYYATKF